MARRRQQSYRNSLRPGLLANGIIASVILAGIGMSYAWLGWQKKTRGDQNNATRNTIEQLNRQTLQQRVDERVNADRDTCQPDDRQDRVCQQHGVQPTWPMPPQPEDSPE